ncbi:MAG TPA: PAAR-like domain-containing protein [Planctomycetota bacterium]|nr:PAAR-like domain-containing protein [Planctomycetota bacterium]
MSNAVFANGREVSCKSGAGKGIAAFPDVCFTPPQTPATPPGVPIPYPNNAMASDTDGGSKKVKISGKEVSLKNKSSFKKSTGDEAGSAPKKGLISSTNKGKAYFKSWSMDVKCEGENVVRHLDMMTHNHASDAGSTPPWPFTDKQNGGKDSDCADEKKAEEKACKDYKPKGKKDVCKSAGLKGDVIQGDEEAQAVNKKYSSASDWADDMTKKANANECIKARRCQLVPYDAEKDGINGCCPSQTADHLIPKSSFYKVSVEDGKKLSDWKDYSPSKAPCICAEGGSNTAGSHGLRHAHHKAFGPEEGSMQSFGKQAELAAEGAALVFADSGCSKECIEEQLKNGHKGMGDQRSKVKHSPSGTKMDQGEVEAHAAALNPQTTSR